MPTIRSALALACASGVALAGCEDPGPLVDCTGGGVGSIRVTANIAGDGVAVVYDVDGNEVGRITGDQTLDGLAGGAYLVEAWRGEGDPEGLVAATATGVPDAPYTAVCVGDGQTTDVSLTWDTLPSSAHLWVSSGESLAAFTADQIEAGGPQTADIVLEASLVNDFRGFAFDRTGVLWAATSPTYGARLMFWGPDRLTGRGEAEPDGELHSSALASVGDVAFTADGTLWVMVSDIEWHGLLGFSHTTLATAVLDGGGDVAPDWTRTVDPLAGDADLEVDPDGAVWIADFWGEAIYRIDDPTDGATGVDATVHVYGAATDAEPLRGPQNLAFDSSGDLVAFFWTATQIALVDAADLGGTGVIEPIAAPGSGVVTDLGNGLVVDGADRSWLGNYTGLDEGAILAWTPGEDLVPHLTSADATDPADLVLDPRPR